MVTELVTFKMEKNFLKDVDYTSKNAGFQNRTEFIRAALRDKVNEVKLKEAMLMLSKNRGKAPRKYSDEEREIVREQVFKEFEKKFKLSPQA
ncbi:MAG: ribbon-helix-helix domain-containing protein [Candidatus Woesearchaeota archaeon]